MCGTEYSTEQASSSAPAHGAEADPGWLVTTKGACAYQKCINEMTSFAARLGNEGDILKLFRSAQMELEACFRDMVPIEELHKQMLDLTVYARDCVDLTGQLPDCLDAKPSALQIREMLSRCSDSQKLQIQEYSIHKLREIKQRAERMDPVQKDVDFGQLSKRLMEIDRLIQDKLLSLSGDVLVAARVQKRGNLEREIVELSNRLKQQEIVSRQRMQGQRLHKARIQEKQHEESGIRKDMEKRQDERSRLKGWLDRYRALIQHGRLAQLHNTLEQPERQVDRCLPALYSDLQRIARREREMMLLISDDLRKLHNMLQHIMHEWVQQWELTRPLHRDWAIERMEQLKDCCSHTRKLCDRWVEKATNEGAELRRFNESAAFKPLQPLWATFIGSVQHRAQEIQKWVSRETCRIANETQEWYAQGWSRLRVCASARGAEAAAAPGCEAEGATANGFEESVNNQLAMMEYDYSELQTKHTSIERELNAMKEMQLSSAELYDQPQIATRNSLSTKKKELAALISTYEFDAGYIWGVEQLKQILLEVRISLSNLAAYAATPVVPDVYRTTTLEALLGKIEDAEQAQQQGPPYVAFRRTQALLEYICQLELKLATS